MSHAFLLTSMLYQCRLIFLFPIFMVETLSREPLLVECEPQHLCVDSLSPGESTSWGFRV